MYSGRLVVPTVLRKAKKRVPQQDLESLVSKSNDRIGLHGGASLRKYVDDATRKLASSKIASEANLSRTRVIREFRRKKKIVAKTELVMMTDDFVEDIFN